MDPSRRLQTPSGDIRLPGRRAVRAPQILSSSALKVCSGCKREQSKYTCPRCHAATCSLACYRAHGAKCTEAFYEKEVKRELKASGVTKEGRAAALSALKRAQRSETGLGTVKEMKRDESNDDEDTELARRSLQRMAISGNFDPEGLDPKLERQFRKMVADGRAGKLLPIWNPWWIPPSSDSSSAAPARWINAPPIPPKVVDEQSWPYVGLDASAPSGNLNGYSDVPTYSSIRAPANPSPLIGNNLLDILYAYAFVSRLYNGDVTGDAVGALAMVMRVSSVLADNTVHTQPIVAMHSAVERAAAAGTGNPAEFNAWILCDVALILHHKPLVLRALADLHNMIARAAPRREKAARGRAREATPSKRTERSTAKQNNPVSSAAHTRRPPPPQHASSEGKDTTIVLTPLPNTVTPKQLREAEARAGRAKRVADDAATGTAATGTHLEPHRGAPPDVTCYEIGRKKETKQTKTRRQIEKRLCRKIVFYVAWVRDKATVSQLARLSEAVVVQWQRKCGEIRRRRDLEAESKKVANSQS